MKRDYSDQGLALTKAFETLSLTAYWDKHGKVWTIGWGHTGRDVHEGMVITESCATELLRQDASNAVRVVNNLVHCDLAQNQFDALVDFTFNLGGPELHESTMLTMLNEGQIDAAGPQFDRFVYSGGVKLAGLVRRRAAERAMFEGTA